MFVFIVLLFILWLLMSSWGCLGALDGTYINVLVSNEDKSRYKTRKGNIATNTLVVCDTNLKFTYFLLGWEGSAAYSRVLQDTIKREDGLEYREVNHMFKFEFGFFI